jgi:hypothetical protein
MSSPFELSQDARDALQAATDAVLADVFGNALADAERQARACGCEAIDGEIVVRCRTHDDKAMRALLLEDELRAARHALLHPPHEKLARVVEILERHHMIDGETAQRMVREIVDVILGRLEQPPA